MQWRRIKQTEELIRDGARGKSCGHGRIETTLARRLPERWLRSTIRGTVGGGGGLLFKTELRVTAEGLDRGEADVLRVVQRRRVCPDPPPFVALPRGT